MKNKKYLFVPFLLAIMIFTFFAASQVKSASAQTQCLDAAGGPIPCPPTEEIPCGQAGGPACPPPPDNGGGNKRPTVTPIPPTATSLPISAAPTSLPDENYLGSCSNADGNIFDCIEKFKCENGLLVIKVDLYTGNGTKYDFYCIPDETVPQLNLPLSIPDPVGKDANWTGGCNSGAGLDACLDLASDHCSQEGGEISIWYDDDGAGVYCQNQSEASPPAPDATPLPFTDNTSDDHVIGEEDWVASCKGIQCFSNQLACVTKGGTWSFLKYDDFGNSVYLCDMPEGSTANQNNLKQLGLASIGVVLIGLLVPAVQKVRSAAARTQSSNSARMINNKNPELLKNQDDGGTEARATLYGRKAGDDKRRD